MVWVSHFLLNVIAASYTRILHFLKNIMLNCAKDASMMPECSEQLPGCCYADVLSGFWLLNALGGG